jgi:hypothetical protein
MFTRKQKRKPEPDELDRPLLRWTANDIFTRRDLSRSVCVQGASGSGKTNFVGYSIAKALVRDRSIGGIILASKPVEDRQHWQGIFAEAGRSNDLLIFALDSPLRCNVLNWELQNGADSRELAHCLTVYGETLRRGEGSNRENDQFFKDQSERMLQLAIEPVRLATGEVSPVDVQRFINGAAMTPEQLQSPQWRADFHNRILKAGFDAKKTPIEGSDYEQVLEYWLGEIPNLNDRTRSSITTQVMGTLHVLCSGAVRELLSTTTNFTPAAMDAGKWILIDMAVSRHGMSGALVNAAWKLMVQRHILRRHAPPGSPITVIWVDEFQNHLNSFDPKFLAECRSHRGCMFVLTQSLHSYYAALNGGQAAEHEANALLTNFAHRIFCSLGDAKSAEWASGLLGKRLETMIGGSMAPQESMWDTLMGRTKFTGSFSQQYEPILQPNVFMHNLRTGRDGVADAIVIRPERFGDGQNFLKVAFRRS